MPPAASSRLGCVFAVEGVAYECCGRVSEAFRHRVADAASVSCSTSGCRGPVLPSWSITRVPRVYGPIVTAMSSQVSAQVRPVTEGELGDWIGSLITSFLGEREVTREQVAWNAQRMDLSRTFGAFSDGRVCGTSRTFPTKITVPGGAAVDAAAVTQVSVLPNHTRQGHLSSMMAAMLDDARRRGEPIAILVASEWPIYGRFGYGPAAYAISYELDTEQTQFFAPASGSVELVGVHELRSMAPQIYEPVRSSTVGALDRDPKWWDQLIGTEIRPGATLPKNRVRVVWRDSDGVPRGYAVYDAQFNWTINAHPDGELQLRELFAATAEAHQQLWRYMCEVDLVKTIKATHRPVDEPLPYHLRNGRAVQVRARFDHLWVALLDVRECLGRRTYAVPGRLVLGVDAPNGERSVYRLEGAPTGAAVELSGDQPDLVMGAGALGATYLGGTTFRSLASAGRVEERVPGSIERADTMFSVRPAPFLTTSF